MRWPWQHEEAKIEPERVQRIRENTERALEEQRRVLEDAARVGAIDLESDTYRRHD